VLLLCALILTLADALHPSIEFLLGYIVIMEFNVTECYVFE